MLPGVQLPVHTPPVHTPVLHATDVPHWPSLPHVCTPDPVESHRTAMGVHTPQAPLKQMDPEHAIDAPKFPIASHVCTPVPAESHCVVPGVHVPPHAPLTHADDAHAEPMSCHVPVWSQSCGCWPLHWRVPG